MPDDDRRWKPEGANVRHLPLLCAEGGADFAASDCTSQEEKIPAAAHPAPVARVTPPPGGRARAPRLPLG
jgi:hypothetical protein